MLKNTFISLAIWAVDATLTFILFLAMVAAIILFPFDRQRKRAHAQCYWWSDAVMRVNPFWRLEVKGLENIDRSRTYVIVSNHASLADIVVIYQTRMQFKWVAKESLFAIPVLGWNMLLARHIRIKRGDFSSIKAVYREAAEWLRDGMSVLFFPEGTRSETGAVGEFQNGAFKLAIKEKVPLLPIALEGTNEAIPKGNWRFSARSNCRVSVFPAIETANLGPGDFAGLRDKARAIITRTAP